ncbi:MAG TPA: lysine--tRNA ligase, partial [Chromatiales bacterium]|nr:lysine--tRNA ligase [Chromatiales bacterium]
MSESDDNRLIAERRAKLAALRERGPAFPNDFRRDALAADLHRVFDDVDGERLEADPHPVRIAGRMLAKRVMGKASFAQLQDMSGRIQVFLQRDALPDGVYADFKGWDVGDIVGVEGPLFRTRTGELTVRAGQARLLVKSLRPLPEKFHGLTNQELRYRQRYVDLVMNESTREVFRLRSAIVRYLRRFLDERGFIEVETPMMQAIPGGATARPFITHHNALEMDLYLRVAPELYLKRLVVGGLEKVYELNRNFRNEGVSTRHNPEFTMLEFYQAYAGYEDLMDLTETLFRDMAVELLGDAVIRCQGKDYDFGRPFARMTVREALLRFTPELADGGVDDPQALRALCARHGVAVEAHHGVGRLQMELFDKSVEAKLADPTFITAYPTEVSPLARRNDADPSVTDRFELIVDGREIANGFSELNDPEDQAERFRRQSQEKAAG